MRFEWNTEKGRANQAKHGVAFGSAALVFGDPNIVFREDRIVDGEQRRHAIGAAREALLPVVHVYREDSKNGEEIIRIIPAREASRRERGIYLQQAGQ
jgi:hypothetical protein